MTQTDLVIFVADTGRRYIDAADVATICGGTFRSWDIDNKFRPFDWATPRDFRWDGKRLWIAEESLNQLADSLAAAGAFDGALLLRAWLGEHLARVAVAHVRDTKLVAPITGRDAQARWEEQNDR